jgi:hypothetical protein
MIFAKIVSTITITLRCGLPITWLEIATDSIAESWILPISTGTCRSPSFVRNGKDAASKPFNKTMLEELYIFVDVPGQSISGSANIFFRLELHDVRTSPPCEIELK